MQQGRFREINKSLGQTYSIGSIDNHFSLTFHLKWLCINIFIDKGQG